MNKRNGQYILAVISFAIAGALQYFGVDAVVLAAGASSVFAALAGYNTLNPNLSSDASSLGSEGNSISEYNYLSELHDSPLDSSSPFSCGLPDCCGNPNNCEKLEELNDESA